MQRNLLVSSYKVKYYYQFWYKLAKEIFDQQGVPINIRVVGMREEFFLGYTLLINFILAKIRSGDMKIQ